MYMTSESDRTWLLNVQRKLYQRSWQNPDYVFQELWGWVMDPRNLRIAFARVSRNRGHRTAGVDGVPVGKIVQGIRHLGPPFKDLRGAQRRSGDVGIS